MDANANANNAGQDEDDLEISDGEAPDVEDAKRNLRKLQQKKLRQKKTVV